MCPSPSVVSIAAGLWSVTRSPVMAVVAALFPIPKIALVPLFIIWFGIGEGSKIATISLGVFFPTVIATMGEQRGLDEAISLGVGPLRSRRGPLARAARETAAAVLGPARAAA